MFDILFGWRKASKCKKLIKRVQCRLKLLKCKRNSIVRQLREDVVQLVNTGYEDIAFNRAEHLFQDETTVSVYELLENFCEFIIAHLSYIRRHRDCPNDINEAVSSLIFASARCGDLPELRAIRKLFGERYGQRFAVTAVDLLPGNLVNLQLKEKLSIQSVPDEVKQKLVDEIARDYCLRPEILALEYTSEPQQQAKENGSIVGSCKMEAANADDIEGKAIYVDAVSTVASPVQPDDVHQDDMISTCISSSIVEQSSSDIMESPMNSFPELHLSPKFEDLAFGSKETQMTGRPNFYKPYQNEVRKMAASSSESLPQFPEEMIVYLDDVEEVHHSIAKEGSTQDQRTFKFKSPLLPKNNKGKEEFMDPYESWSDCSNSSGTRKRVKAARRRTRRRSTSIENSRVKDIHCVIYYEKHYKRSTTHGSLHSKHHMKNLAQNHEQSFHIERNRKQPQYCQCFNPEAKYCCLSSPCYFCNGDGTDTQEVPPSNQVIISHVLERKHGHNDFRRCKCSNSISVGKSDAEMEWYTLPPRPRRRSCDFGDIPHDSFTQTDCKPDKQSKITKGKAKGVDATGSHVASNDSSCETSPLARKAIKPPYSRAMTMPQERSKESKRDNILQHSKSFPLQSPNHVHPKLPDYDEIAAKFTALKKEHLEIRHH